MVPAILINDKVVIGSNHGDAFSKLTEEEKNDTLLSGFVDYHQFKFITDDGFIYLKEIILLRHAQSDINKENGPITEEGQIQASRLACFIKTMNLNGYQGFCSPYERCQQTSRIIEDVCCLAFSINDKFSKQYPKEQDEIFYKRISDTLDFLPEKSILITHTDFIQNVLYYTHFIKDRLRAITNCSITYISQNKLIWLARNINAEENRS